MVKFKTSNINGSYFSSKHSGELRRKFEHFNVAVADLTLQNLESLQMDPSVDYVEEDSIVKTSSTSFSNWGLSDIKAKDSWQLGLTGKGVKIAIIDTGSDLQHPNLKIAGGINVIGDSITTSYDDDNGHGTHVTGIIAAQGVNGGTQGVSPGASIYVVKALDSKGSGYLSDIISGIDWAIENKINIISMSLGEELSKPDSSLQNAVDTAYNHGILIVAAAGNSGNAVGIESNVKYPANYASVIAVGAVDYTNIIAYFSSKGSKVEVCAPGVNVISTYLNGKYAQMSGTSMAAPFVAGDLALLKEKYPTATNVQLRQLLDNNVIDLGVKGRDPLYGFGLIQAPNNITPVMIQTPVAAIIPMAKPTVSVVAGINGWNQNAGIWYYYKAGAKATGWLKYGLKWYYLNNDGAMVKGWKQIGSKWYYLNDNGDMAASTITPDGYKVDMSGVWIP